MSTDSPFDPPPGSLRASVGRGAVLTAASQGVMMTTQIASVVILSRLLAPEEFGLVAMCAPVMVLVGMLQEFGLVQATVQKPGLRRDEVNFLFWVNLGLACSLALLLFLLSPLIALFYQEPRVGPLIAAMAVNVVLIGTGAQHAALMNRRMQYGRLAVIMMAGTTASLATATVWALVHPSYWALFGGQLAGALVPAVLAWVASPWRPGLPRGAKGARSLIGFGAGITGHNFIEFLGRNLDSVLIGRFWGGVQLGLYDRAYKLMLLPLHQVSWPLSRVMIPALSRMLEEPGRLRSAYLRVLSLVLLLILPGVACLIALAEVFFPFALGPQWTASAPIFMALGFAGLMHPLNTTAGWLFISQGRSTGYMIWGMIAAGMAALAVVLGVPYGALGVAIALSVAEYLKTPILWYLVGRKGAVGWRDVAATAAPLISAAHLALAVLWLARPWLMGSAPLVLLQGAALTYLVMVVAILPFASGRAVLREAATLLRGLLARRPGSILPQG